MIGSLTSLEGANQAHFSDVIDVLRSSSCSREPSVQPLFAFIPSLSAFLFKVRYRLTIFYFALVYLDLNSVEDVRKVHKQ